ncbi:sestrin-1 isoform X3 [Latimeria chalumnae]|uniref:sestrin-1 isoform X3 n=1 Tax=Latimeria chalumnae TaxID=7897 RepID=UPI0003C14D99|nr:PREDICTED: sestrin-1 isoform X3 [Latimeria chalumnae]|eukprot:XP_006003802.1 PREDICTED: sestrin-1 isoform X3 [Latimeria chalumnae]
MGRIEQSVPAAASSTSTGVENMIIRSHSRSPVQSSHCQRVQPQVAKMSLEKDRPQLLFVKALASRGRLDPVTQQMGYHPQYLDSFLKTQHYLLHMDGPLPFPCRHYIAVMSLLKIEEQCWSLAELVHAVVLLAHYHALASFVFGSGCDQEDRPDSRNLFKIPLVPLGNQCFCDAANGNYCSQELLRINRRRSLDSCVELETLRDRMQRIHIENENREEKTCERTRALPGEQEEDCEDEVVSPPDLSRYVEDPEFGYQDFARREEEQLQIFRVQDYSWEDHGFSLVNRLYSDIGHLLDEKFRTVYALQNGTMAKRQGCDNAVFKRGIWNYIHCMFGIRYDDYDYGEVNHWLERSLKVYIKTVTCHPEKTCSQMFERFWKQFKHSEKVHVNLLILEARIQVELLYALRAITQHMIS